MKIKWVAETRSGKILSAGVTSTIKGWKELQLLIAQGYDMNPILKVERLDEM